MIANWDLSRVIILDKNSKFILNFWQVVFKALNIKLFTITTYHSQVDKQSKKINQTIEIVLRYLISKNFDVNWIIIISSLQFDFNNVSNVFINQISNQLKFDFFFRDLITLLTNNIIDQLSTVNFSRLVYQKKTIHVILFVNTQIKFRYDNKHKLLMLKIDNMIYLRLHKNYNLLNKWNKIFFNQHVESFFVKQRINRLTYELNLFSTLRVYLIISITQLKLIDIFVDFYQRFKCDYSKFININQSNNNEKNSRYEMKKIVDRRFRIFEKIKI